MSALALVVGLAATVPLRAQESRPAEPDPQRFAAEIERFAESDARNSVPEHAVLFVGSSSIRLWPTHESFPALAVINRGFGGSHVTDVTYFFDRVVKPYRPRVIVFYAGDNDIASGRVPAAVRDDFAAFLRRVRSEWPRTPVVFLAIKPSPARWEHWPRMQAANELIRGLAADDPHLHVVDTATPLLDTGGQPRAECYLPDRLHLNAEGYRRWTEALRPKLQALLAIGP